MNDSPWRDAVFHFCISSIRNMTNIHHQRSRDIVIKREKYLDRRNDEAGMDDLILAIPLIFKSYGRWTHRSKMTICRSTWGTSHSQRRNWQTHIPWQTMTWLYLRSQMRYEWNITSSRFAFRTLTWERSMFLNNNPLIQILAM